jgi:deoxyribonuclease V
MKYKKLHSWNVSIGRAKEIQLKLRKKIRFKPLKRIKTVAAVDVSFIKNVAVGVAAVFSYPDLELIEKQVFVSKPKFPYVPGYLTFREGSIMLGALTKLRTTPDVILFDGQGIAHPRGMGEAAHLGVLLDRPSIGCAKSRLIGEYKEPGKRKGSFSKIHLDGKIIGAVVRTREGVKPNFVSVGHKVDLNSAIKVVLGCSTKYRIPDPLRFVHMESVKHARKAS